MVQTCRQTHQKQRSQSVQFRLFCANDYIGEIFSDVNSFFWSIHYEAEFEKLNTRQVIRVMEGKGGWGLEKIFISRLSIGTQALVKTQRRKKLHRWQLQRVLSCIVILNIDCLSETDERLRFKSCRYMKKNQKPTLNSRLFSLKNSLSCWFEVILVLLKNGWSSEAGFYSILNIFQFFWYFGKTEYCSL